MFCVTHQRERFVPVPISKINHRLTSSSTIQVEEDGYIVDQVVHSPYVPEKAFEGLRFKDFALGNMLAAGVIPSGDVVLHRDALSGVVNVERLSSEFVNNVESLKENSNE